ncbi:site-specific integrase [Sphingobacterium siyangense]|uniref:site-specific integrase n=1 Tax=Sphingobacterium siyangense TaxID=459529 RepID=UPI003DA4A8B9
MLKNGVNAGKKIYKARLKSRKEDAKKLTISFEYFNSAGEKKYYTDTYKLNKEPYVVNGVVNTNKNVVRQRFKFADHYVDMLNEMLQDTVFDVDRHMFIQEGKNKLFVDLLNEFISWKSKKVTASSLITYQSVINEIIKYLSEKGLQNISLKNVDVYLIENLVDRKLDYSNSRANYYLTVLSNFYKKYLIKFLGILTNDENIVSRVERYKQNETKKHAIYNNIDKAFSDLTEHKFYLGFMAKVIYYSLHRMDTITKLQYKDFNLKEGIINIPSDKIKTTKKLTIRISKHLLPSIQEYVEKYPPQPNDFWFGHNNMVLNCKGKDSYDIVMFGKFKTPSYTISHHFDEFKKKKGTDKTLFTKNHTLYGFKANGYTYFKNGGDKKQRILSDEQIIKLTGHSNTAILKKYSREYEAIIPKDIWDNL